MEEKFQAKFFCLYLIGTLHATTDHGELVPEGGKLVFLIPHGIRAVVKFKQNLMTLKFKMSTLPGSLNFEVYMPKNRHFWPFFWGRSKLKHSNFNQILHGRSSTCSLGAHQISAFQVHAF